jgi:hypothetical protein
MRIEKTVLCSTEEKDYCYIIVERRTFCNGKNNKIMLVLLVCFGIGIRMLHVTRPLNGLHFPIFDYSSLCR